MLPLKLKETIQNSLQLFLKLLFWDILPVGKNAGGCL
jgi:hypothetical protein